MIGPCSFTTDCHRHQVIEASPIIPDASNDCSEPNVSLKEALEFTTQYTCAVSGALDLFDSRELLEQVRQWAQDPLKLHWPNCSTLFLVLAIGAQARAQSNSDTYTAERYFNYGRHQATMHLMDDQSIVTVQSFSLITWYLVTACRRSAAVVNLGIAIQAAFTLGIHQREANQAFEQQARMSRERAWKTLRVCDVFLSCSMGRPLSTSHLDYNHTWKSPVHDDDQDGSDKSGKGSSAIMQLCLIFERILLEVYSKHTVSLELANSISQQHRQWTAKLPQMLQIDGLAATTPYEGVEMTEFLGSATLTMAYYWSIILLTRPFLTFLVSSCVSNKRHRQHQGQHSPDVTTYSDACITSAIKDIRMAHQVVHHDGTPKRLPLAINSVFISALSLGLAYFADYDCHGWPLDDALTQAMTVLTYFAAHNPQAARYLQIIGMLWEAASKYRNHRNGSMLLSQSQRVSNLFGDVGGQTEGGSMPIPAIVHVSNDVIRGFPNFEASQIDGRASSALPDVVTSQEWDTILEHSMITPSSGELASTMANVEGYEYPISFHFESNQNPTFSAISPFGSSNLSYGNEVPLFAVTDSYQAQEWTV